jgi:hypothetical protein
VTEEGFELVRYHTREVGTLKLPSIGKDSKLTGWELQQAHQTPK